MTRILLALVACWFSVPCLAENPVPPLVERFLHQGKFAEGEVALNLALSANPTDDQARFGLGIVQFFRAVENLGQAMYEYGAISENQNMPFMRLPVPKNENPSAITYQALGRVLELFAADLSRAESTLAVIKDEEVKLPLRLATIQFDFAGNGQNRTSLIEVLKKINGGRAFEFEKNNPDFRIHFDRGDVAWLRAYCHLLGAMVNAYRSVDEQAGFEQRVKNIFPRIETPPNAIEPDWINGGVTLKDPARLHRVRLQLLAVCELNTETWKHYRNEKDNDYEWLGNSKQTEQLGLPITEQQINAWLSMVNELKELFEGNALLPSELLVWFVGDKLDPMSGLNIQKLLDDPPHDLLNMNRIREKGIDAKYMESLKDKRPINIALLFQSFQFFEGPLGFARAARMN